jgi:hypothetical protein
LFFCPFNPCQWHVVATGPADTASSGLFEVAAWLEISQGGGSTMTIEFKVEVDKSQIEFFDDAEDKSPEVKAFQIQFRTPEDHSQQSPEIAGFIRTSKTGPIRTMQFMMRQGVDNQYMTQGLSVSYDEIDEIGWAKQARPSYDQQTQSVVEIEENLGWNSRFFKQSESLCLDREQFVAVGQEYKLFDNTGALVDVESHIDVKKTIEAADSATLAAEGKVIAAGTTFEGGLSPWGFYVYPEVRVCMLHAGTVSSSAVRKRAPSFTHPPTHSLLPVERRPTRRLLAR